MKVGTKLFTLSLLILISTWFLSGCSPHEPAVTANIDTPQEERDDDHSEQANVQHAPDQRAQHDHAQHAPSPHAKDQTSSHEHTSHKAGAHKDHKHGEHHHRETAPSPASVKVGDKVPDFSLRTQGGKMVKLSELQKDKGRTKNGVVVLSFWCSTCHSCRDVEQLLARLSKDYEGQAAVMALCANAGETTEGVAAFLKENALELPVVLDPSGSTADLFGVKRTTTTVVIDGDGVLRYCGQFRQKKGGSAEAALQAVLAGKEVAIKTTPHFG